MSWLGITRSLAEGDRKKDRGTLRRRGHVVRRSSLARLDLQLLLRSSRGRSLRRSRRCRSSSLRGFCFLRLGWLFGGWRRRLLLAVCFTLLASLRRHFLHPHAFGIADAGSLRFDASTNRRGLLRFGLLHRCRLRSFCLLGISLRRFGLLHVGLCRRIRRLLLCARDTASQSECQSSYARAYPPTNVFLHGSHLQWLMPRTTISSASGSKTRRGRE